MKRKIILLLILLTISFGDLFAQKNQTILMCNNYTCKVVDSFGCGNYKFKKECDLETIWNWGDGSNPTISNDKYTMHQYCKSGKYLVIVGSDALEWDFGDGTTSRDLYPQHIYTSGGD